ncbi:MAG: hypothetical protein ACRCZ6_00505 [Kluyvera sp.]|uniref:hypothetical protein n=1 Tax=Kluyvera sp. TaxID=1538228 RepID=UPI003F2F9BA9
MNWLVKDETLKDAYDIRTSVKPIKYICQLDIPHVANLFEQRKNPNVVSIYDVPGNGYSSIEKMTHPVSYNESGSLLSPFLMWLCQSEEELNTLIVFFKKNNIELFSPKDERKIREDFKLIKKFYSIHVKYGLSKIKLGGKWFIEQKPTRPYFCGQKIITNDLQCFRYNDYVYKKILTLASRFRDGGGKNLLLNFIIRYVKKIQSLEKKRFIKAQYINKNDYFSEMYEYLLKCGKPGDFISQSSLECSTDRHTVHFQFIQDTTLPLFIRSAERNKLLIIERVPWYLPVFSIIINPHAADSLIFLKYLQVKCNEFSLLSQVSVTPIFRKLNSSNIEMLLILKKDCSSKWRLDKTIIENMPGWLESCGVFISNSHQANKFNRVSMDEYYEDYCAPEKYVNLFLEIVNNFI